MVSYSDKRFEVETWGVEITYSTAELNYQARPKPVTSIKLMFNRSLATRCWLYLQAPKWVFIWQCGLSAEVRNLISYLMSLIRRNLLDLAGPQSNRNEDVTSGTLTVVELAGATQTPGLLHRFLLGGIPSSSTSTSANSPFMAFRGLFDVSFISDDSVTSWSEDGSMTSSSKACMWNSWMSFL